MSTYKSQNLFASGPHTFHVRGRSLRYETIEQPGADGAEVVPLGRTALRIEQTGTLAADRIDDLQARLDAIEAAMDGAAGELVDDRRRAWPRMVLIHFDPAPIRRLGLRLLVDYSAAYVQSNESPLPL